MKTESAPLTLRDTLENHQVQIYFGAVILGALAALSISGTTALEIGINPSLAFMLFVTFLQVPLAELRMALAQFRFLGVLLLANFVVMPMLVGVLVPFLPPDPMIRLGVLLVLLAHASTMSLRSPILAAPTPVSCWQQHPRS